MAMELQAGEGLRRDGGLESSKELGTTSFLRDTHMQYTYVTELLEERIIGVSR